MDLLSVFKNSVQNVVTSDQVKRKEAERNLIMVERQLRYPYQELQTILGSVDCVKEHFFAAQMFKRCIIRDFDEYPNVGVVLAMTDYCFKCLMTLDFIKQNYPIRTQIILSLCILCKRSWMKYPPDQFQIPILNKVDAVLSSNLVLGLQILYTFVQEFSLNRSQKVGMTFEIHEQSRVNFQENALFVIHKKVLMILQTMSQQQSPPNFESLKYAFQLLYQILCWDFISNSALHRTLSKMQEEFIPKKIIFLKLHREWAQIFEGNEMIQVLLFFYQKKDIRLREDLSSSIRNSLSRLSCVSSRSFSCDSKKVQYMFFLSETYLTLITKTFDLVKTNPYLAGTELICFTNALKDLFYNFKLELWTKTDKLPKVIQALGQVTISAIQASASTSEDIYLDSLDSLFQIWIELLTQVNTDQFGDNVNNVVNQNSMEIFKSFIQIQFQSQLKQVITKNIFLNIGNIARQTIQFSSTFLLHLLQQRVMAFEQSVKSSQNPPSMYELLFLIEIVSATLTDNASGEANQIPIQIRKQTTSHSMSTDPTIEIISQLFRLADLELKCVEKGIVSHCSVALSTKLMAFFQRFVAAYLMPVSNCHPTTPLLYRAYGNKAEGTKISEFLLRKVISNCFQYPNRNFELVSASLKVLRKLVFNHSVCSYYLEHSASWKTLIEEDQNTHRLLPVDELRAELTEILCHGCNSTKATSSNGVKYLEVLLPPIKNQLYSVLQNKNFAQEAQNPQVKDQVLYCIRKMARVCKAARAPGAKYVYEFLEQFQIFFNMKQLVEIYFADAFVMQSILELFFQTVEILANYLDCQQLSNTYQLCLSLIFQYVNLSKNVPIEADDEDYRNKHLLCILQMFTSMLQREYFQTQERPVHVNAISTLFHGLTIILPLVTKDILDYPDVRTEYFTLVGILVESFTENVAELPTEIFQNVIRTIVSGTKHFEAEIVRASFDAIFSIGFFHITSIQNQKPGFTKQLKENPDMLKFILDTILYSLLFEPVLEDAMEELSKAILVLIIWTPKLYQETALKMIAQIPNQNNQQRCLQAFQKLQEYVPNDIKIRANRTKFSKMMQEFIKQVQSFSYSF